MNKVNGFLATSVPTPAGSPYANGSPAPTEGPSEHIAAQTEVFLNSAPSRTVSLAKRITCVDIDYTDIKAQANVHIGPEIPDNAIICQAFADITVGFTSGGANAATLGLGFTTDAATGIRAAGALGAGIDLTGIALKALAPVVETPGSYVKLTAARQLLVTRAGGQDLTAGHMVVFIEWCQSV